MSLGEITKLLLELVPRKHDHTMAGLVDNCWGRRFLRRKGHYPVTAMSGLLLNGMMYFRRELIGHALSEKYSVGLPKGYFSRMNFSSRFVKGDF